MSRNLNCEYFGVCGGCPWGGQSLPEQQTEKLAMMADLSLSATLSYMPAGHVRDKVDLVWSKVNGEMRLGLYGLNSREIVDLKSCVMMTKELAEFYQRFRAIVPPIEKGSVRLRVSPDGEWGVWLDFANEDVKTLFEEKEYLRALSEIAFVEIGQRRKALEWRNGVLKLGAPVLKPWFQTYTALLEPISLYGSVGGFSQVGFKANEALVRAVAEAADTVSAQRWVDLFCGNGNFTLALASRGYSVEAIELDELALEGLQTSAASHAEWNERIRIQKADIYLKAETLPSFDKKGLIVDPPRAGLRELLLLLESGAAGKPDAIIYVSCHSEALREDATKLFQMNYKLKSLVGVDQFPQSPHCEWVALFTF